MVAIIRRYGWIGSVLTGTFETLMERDNVAAVEPAKQIECLELEGGRCVRRVDESRGEPTTQPNFSPDHVAPASARLSLCAFRCPFHFGKLVSTSRSRPSTAIRPSRLPTLKTRKAEIYDGATEASSLLL